MGYAIFGPSMPGILIHPGASLSQLIDHLYLTTQGIYGIALGVVATYVFHFVLFGVFATRIGLGQLFLDCAAFVAGRFAGGPATVRSDERRVGKVCVRTCRSRWSADH